MNKETIELVSEKMTEIYKDAISKLLKDVNDNQSRDSVYVIHYCRGGLMYDTSINVDEYYLEDYIDYDELGELYKVCSNEFHNIRHEVEDVIVFNGKFLRNLEDNYKSSHELHKVSVRAITNKLNIGYYTLLDILQNRIPEIYCEPYFDINYDSHSGKTIYSVNYNYLLCSMTTDELVEFIEHIVLP